MTAGADPDFMVDPALTPWLEQWRLEPDGGAFSTPYTRSLLLPVRRDGRPAILKLAGGPEEARGGRLMAWWAGEGAAPVLAHEGDAILLARSDDPDALSRLAFEGGDAAATTILCRVLAVLHRPVTRSPPAELVFLDRWFRALREAQATDPTFARAWTVAEGLLASPRDVGVLHGDLTHANVLPFGSAGWLAIDPKGLIGERGYDYANIFRSPAIAMATPTRFRAQLDLIADQSNLERDRLHRWAIAHGALSAAWYVEDGGDPRRALAFVRMALAELDAA